MKTKETMEVRIACVFVTRNVKEFPPNAGIFMYTEPALTPVSVLPDNVAMAVLLLDIDKKLVTSIPDCTNALS